MRYANNGANIIRFYSIEIQIDDDAAGAADAATSILPIRQNVNTAIFMHTFLLCTCNSLWNKHNSAYILKLAGDMF